MQAEELLRQGKPVSRAGAILVIALWGISFAAAGWLILRAVLR